MSDHINSGSVPKLTAVNSKAFAAKASGKREVYRLLSMDANVYLPAYEVVTIYNMRDLMCNVRWRIKCHKIHHINVPQYAGLSIEEMMAWAVKRPGQVMMYLPAESREREKLP